ncbi:MAG: glycosyltransferase family 9 protein [Terrimicrobiaceae bacterium]
MNAVPPEPKAVLIVCLRYLGDTLLLRPALRALRAAFPQARLDVVVTAGTACALDDCADVSRVIEWPRRSLLSGLFLAGGIARSGHDWVIDFTGNDRSALVALASRARFRVAYERPKLPAWSLRRAAYHFRPRHKKTKPHALIQRLELLEACGVASQGIEFGLKPRTEAIKAVRRKLEGMPSGIFHAHVTSRDMQKAIPADIVREVLAAAIEDGRGVVVTCGSGQAEREHAALSTQGLPSEKYRIFHDLDWHGLVAAISLCGHYWGSDTAPAHIAAALGKNMLIHFGPSRADHWRPLHAGGLADIQSCDCLKNKRVECPRGTPGKCLQNIQAADVVTWMKS